MLTVSSTNCNNEQQSFAKLSYSAIDNVLTSLLPADLQDFYHVLNVLNATHAMTTSHRILITTEYLNAHFFCLDLFVYVLQVGLHWISYPAPAPAEIRPNFHIRPGPDMAAGCEAGYEVGFDHLSMHLPLCVIGQEFIVLQIQ